MEREALLPPAMPPPPAPPGVVGFLDPQDLMDRSEIQPRADGFWLVAGSLLLIVMLGSWVASQEPAIAGFVRALGGLAMLAAAVAMTTYTWNRAKRRNDELRRVESIEELVQLRRWPDAGVALQGLMSSPMRTPQGRVQAMVYLSTVLGRLQRYADAVTVQEYLLANVLMDDASSHALRCGRAIAMLHEDRLVDADRAITELRRTGPGRESAGLALVEIYRDVKTGHPAEAIEQFRSRLPQLKRQLGHRAADAWALVARAYDMVGQAALAAEAYFNATALAPIAEISRRYSEVAALTGKYAAAPAPIE